MSRNVNPPAVSAFVFGKLPAHGDFVARGLGVGDQAGWDDWLTAELVVARAVHGADFDARYASAPVWHFAHDDVAGALALSVDSAGRRFPILAGATGGAAMAGFCEDRLYDAIAQRWDADRLYAAIEAADVSPEDTAPKLGWWTPGNADFAEDRLPGARPEGLLARMLGPQETLA